MHDNLLDGYLASNGELSSLLSDAVDGLVSTQAHGRIDTFVTGSAKRYAGVQCTCANHWIVLFFLLFSAHKKQLNEAEIMY